MRISDWSSDVCSSDLNTMFQCDTAEVASLLDFEVASLGPPEIDLAHWMYLDDVFSTNFGIARIAGIPDENAAIRGFERIYGWPIPYFSYYLAVRSEEHTSELQSLMRNSYAVFCLKKKKITQK